MLGAYPTCEVPGSNRYKAWSGFWIEIGVASRGIAEPLVGFPYSLQSLKMVHSVI